MSKLPQVRLAGTKKEGEMEVEICKDTGAKKEESMTNETLRDVLKRGERMSGWNTRNEVARRTSLPRNLVEQIIAENNWDAEGTLKDIEAARPHEWAVSTDERGWVIVDIYTGKIKFIGIAGAKRTNYYDVALNEAAHRNRKYGIVARPRMVHVFPETKENILKGIQIMRVEAINPRYFERK